jgi:hypothetical protein
MTSAMVIFSEKSIWEICTRNIPVPQAKKKAGKVVLTVSTWLSPVKIYVFVSQGSRKRMEGFW